MLNAKWNNETNSRVLNCMHLSLGECWETQLHYLSMPVQKKSSLYFVRPGTHFQGGKGWVRLSLISDGCWPPAFHIIQDYEQRILEARQQDRATKEEAASLYAQLQQVCNHSKWKSFPSQYDKMLNSKMFLVRNGMPIPMRWESLRNKSRPSRFVSILFCLQLAKHAD